MEKLNSVTVRHCLCIKNDTFVFQIGCFSTGVYVAFFQVFNVADPIVSDGQIIGKCICTFIY